MTTEKVFEYIQEYYKKRGVGPSVRTIMRHFGWKSPSTVSFHLKKLVEKKLIRFDKEVRRYVPFIIPNTVLIPVLGKANAGEPLLPADQQVSQYLEIDKALLPSDKDLFAVEIVGDSMDLYKVSRNNALVYLKPGYFAVISPNLEVKKGDAVLAIINDAATIKKYEGIKDGLLVLKPVSSNPTHTPLYLSADKDFVINGKVVFAVPGN